MEQKGGKFPQMSNFRTCFDKAYHILFNSSRNTACKYRVVRTYGSEVRNTNSRNGQFQRYITLVDGWVFLSELPSLPVWSVIGKIWGSEMDGRNGLEGESSMVNKNDMSTIWDKLITGTDARLNNKSLKRSDASYKFVVHKSLLHTPFREPYPNFKGLELRGFRSKLLRDMQM